MRRPLRAALILISTLLAGGCFALGWDYKATPETDGGSGGRGGDSGAGGTGASTSGAGGDAPDASAPSPVELAAGEPEPRPVTVDGTYVYWGNQGVSQTLRGLRRIPKGGGMAETIAPTEQVVWDIAFNGTLILWIDTGDDAACAAGPGQDRLMQFDGTAVVQLWSQGACRYPRGVAADGIAAFWTRETDNRVMRRLLLSGSTGTIASGQNGPYGVAMDANTVYWSTYNDGVIRTYTRANGAIADFAASPPHPTRIALDQDVVYWIAEHEVLHMAKTTPGQQPGVLAGNLGLLAGLAVDSAHVYVTDAMAGTVLRIPKDGSTPPVTLASGQAEPSGIAADGSAVYWANAGSGQIMMLATE